MNKFIKGDMVFILARVARDQHSEFIVCHPIMASGEPDTSHDVFAKAALARMEAPLIEVGMQVSYRMMTWEVIAIRGEYGWLAVLDGKTVDDNVHCIAKLSDLNRRDMKPAEIVMKHEEINTPPLHIKIPAEQMSTADKEPQTRARVTEAKWRPATEEELAGIPKTEDDIQF